MVGIGVVKVWNLVREYIFFELWYICIYLYICIFFVWGFYVRFFFEF